MQTKIAFTKGRYFILALLISKFWGFKSRWRTLLLWQNARPRNNWYIKLFTTSRSISPFKLSKYFFRSWSQCSNTSVNFLSLWRTSYNLTIFLCFNSFNKHISLSADDGTPCKINELKFPANNLHAIFFYLTSSSSSSRTLFKATISWVSRFFALKTVP